MSDLISRSAVLKIIDEAIMNTSDFLQHDTQIDIQFKVEELPTAYDVEQVVEELEGRKNRPPELEYRHLNFEEAIEIVRGGGVNEIKN